MTSDIIAPYRPMREWRQKLLKSLDELDIAHRIWFSHADVMLLKGQDNQFVSLPQGFRELTYLLASLCDIGPTSIDPSPLTKFMSAVEFNHLELEEGALRLPQLLTEAVAVLNRMKFSWAAVENREPPGELLETSCAHTGTDMILLSVIDKYGYVESQTDLLDKLSKMDELPEDKRIMSIGTAKPRLSVMKANGTLVAWKEGNGYKRP